MLASQPRAVASRVRADASVSFLSAMGPGRTPRGLLLALLTASAGALTSLRTYALGGRPASNLAPRRRRAPKTVPRAAGLTVGAEAYSQLLEHFPLATKVCTNSVVALAGDWIGQARDPEIAEYSPTRGARFALKGVVGGFFWVSYFDAVDALTACASGVPRVLEQMAVEQFLWCPVYYTLYDIPAASLLNGNSLDRVPGIVKEKLGGMLVSNAKLWTPANLLVYSTPLEFRLAAANVFDLAWSIIASDIAASCQDDEECDPLARDAPEVARSR